MNLVDLPIDLFIKHITYLSFNDVISVCQLNSKMYSYCTNIKYTNHWKKLIDSTFDNVYDYEDKLNIVWNKLRKKYPEYYGVYNYLVYTKLIKLLDPISQLMIYYRQGDMKSFNQYKYMFTDEHRYLALFILKEKGFDITLPNSKYDRYVRLLTVGNPKQKLYGLNYLLNVMVEEGNIQGISLMLFKGADIHFDKEKPLTTSIRMNRLSIIKYLIENGADISKIDQRKIIEYHPSDEIINYINKFNKDIN